MNQAAKRKKTEEPISRFWNKISLVADVAAVIRNEPPGKETFARVLKMIQEIVAFESATLYLYDKKRKRLDEMVSLGERVEPIDFVQFEVGSGITAWAARQKKPVLLSNIRNLDRPPEKTRSSFLSIPLLVAEELIGAVNFAHTLPDFFRDKDLKLLTIVGDQIAISIERLIYQAELEAKNQALQKAHEELMESQRHIINHEKLSAVKELARSVNHEINNPLAVIVGQTQCLALIRDQLAPDLIERLECIENEAMKIAEINRRLLQIEDLVSESYLDDLDGVRMLNLHKSTSGVKG
ncbi:MAG: GAF domain-containing protein [Candidatus Zixiibacteriota bacterium]|jgi:GAF domain-containing protein